MPNQEELRTKMLQGKYKILLFRKYGDEQEDATKLVFQTEHSFDYSRDLDRIVTKDGTVVKVGDLETGVDIDAIQSVKDPAYEMLQEAAIKGEKLELWEVNIDPDLEEDGDRKSTRLNSSHVAISYDVFFLKKKKHDK